MPGELRSVDQHVATILDGVAPLDPYEQPLLEAVGLPICEDITATMDLPRFDNSAMDGYAVRFADVANASPTHPVRLPVIAESVAGTASAIGLSPGSAIKIMTGAPIPFGADAVVPVEHTDRLFPQVSISQAPRAAGQHIRRRGEDVRTGTVVVRDGTVIGARSIGLLASLGMGRISARPRPRVVIMSTGSELVQPGRALGPDAIYDSNSYMIAAAVRASGALAYRVGVVSDRPEDFAEALSDQLVRADLVITTGGVSMGEYDVVKDVLTKSGEVTFSSIAMQPGKPQGFGFVGEDRTPIITLPGNPVSAFVSFEVFVLPAIRRMMGRLPYRRPQVRAALTTDLTSAPGRRQFLRGKFEVTGQGARVTPVGGPGSHLLGGLAESNALIVVGEETTAIKAGEAVSVAVLDREF